ncbi:hypothetical protein QEZ54_15240 [Catellatospora sp. KI3]|uniref:hypothetical protein n=1 Tax=Catellatospora sp. KI3 TaxID=3041620 RepID=UPI002482CDC0|nr:hypothetical protein [Catellatospora sp. KI3]MDI1462323.1 hypothetical protein [Catellatospora sp. KI3]
MGSRWPVGVRAVLYVSGWAAATAVAATVVWIGLRPVLAAAVPEPVPLSLDSVRSPAVAPTRPVVPPAPSRTPSPQPSASSASSVPSAPATGPSPSRRPGGPAPTPHPKPSPYETVEGWQVVPERDGSVSYLRSFATAGGDAVVRIAAGTVHLVSATPRGTYRVAVSQTEDNRLVVQFYDTGRQFIVDTMWWQEKPWAQVSDVS